MAETINVSQKIKEFTNNKKLFAINQALVNPNSASAKQNAQKRLEENRKKITENRKKITESPYYEEFYCGSDVQIYIKGKWFDSITTFQYGETNNKSPLYGYNSQYFDAIAKGTIIVQGQIGIVLTDVQEFNQILGNDTKSVSKYSYVNRIDKTGKVYDTWINPKGFDIHINYGDQTGKYRGGTSRVINSCHVTNETSFVEISENVIMIVYNFFGKCMDNMDENEKYSSANPYTLSGINNVEIESNASDTTTTPSTSEGTIPSVENAVKDNSVIVSTVTKEQLDKINEEYPNSLLTKVPVIENGETKYKISTKNVDTMNALKVSKSQESKEASTDSEKKSIMYQFNIDNKNPTITL